MNEKQMDRVWMVHPPTGTLPPTKVEQVVVFPALAPLFAQKWGSAGRVAAKEVTDFPCCRCAGLEVCKALQALQSTWVLCEAPDERDLVFWRAQGFDVREFVKQLPTRVTAVAPYGDFAPLGDQAEDKVAVRKVPVGYKVRGPTNVSAKTESEDRWCSYCSQWKPTAKFNRSKRDGWQAPCRVCQNEYNSDPGRRARWEENRLQKQMQRG